MRVTRRDFLRVAGSSAAILGISALDLSRLEKAVAAPDAPKVLWLQGAGCTGCSVSFLNRIASSGPATAADVLINSIDLRYHPNLMGAAGDMAVLEAAEVYQAGGYILAVEGGVPTAFGGAACWAWSLNGSEVSFKNAVTSLTRRAAHVLAIGTCAAWGGIAAASPNPAGVRGVRDATGRTTINIAGCPPHPDWVLWTIVQLLLGKSISLDESGRPRYLFGKTVHDQCPRREHDETKVLGAGSGCLEDLGCRGKSTRALCPQHKWNNAVNWCIGAGAPCIGCTEPRFSGTEPFYHPQEGSGVVGSSGDHSGEEEVPRDEEKSIEEATARERRESERRERRDRRDRRRRRTDRDD